MHVFLTGGTGFIGKPLTAALIRRKWVVTVLVRKKDTRDARKLEEMGARLVQGDILDPESLRPGMVGVDAVIHNAGIYEYGIGKKARRQMWATNFTGTKNIIEAAIASKIPRLVYVSSALAYGTSPDRVLDENSDRVAPPLSFYEYTKEAAHHLALRYIREGVPLTLVCPAAVVGPGDQSPWGYFARLYVRGLFPPVVWAPKSIHSQLHCEDAAEGIALALEKGRSGETYLLSAYTHTLREIIETWSRHPGGVKKHVFVPVQLGYLTGAIAAPFLHLLKYPAFLSPEAIRATDTCYRWSGEKAARELGVTYRCLEQTWAEILEAERAQLK